MKAFTITDGVIDDTWIGKAICRKATIETLQNIDFTGKEISISTGITLDNQNIETIPFGNFIIEKPSDEEVKTLTTHTGYDYMIKFRVPYRHSLGSVFTAGSLFDDLCRQAGVGVGSTSFVNSDYIILGNAYTNNETCEDVLKDLAKLAVGFAKIGRDNKCYIKTPTIGSPSESIDGNDYTDTFTTNGKFGEVNALYVGLSQVEGETTERKDGESIAQNGENSIKNNDIAFLINETEREKVIDNMWNAIKGLSYLAGEYTYKGFPYLDAGDEIQLYDNEDNPFTSYAFNIDFSYNGAYSGKIKMPIITNVTATYSPANTIKNTFKKVELSVDKINGMMQSTVEQVNKQNNKISQVTQTLDDLNSKISDIANITIAGESNYAQVELDNINQSEPIMLRVHPILENISYLYPHINLFPSALTYLKTRKIRFTRTYDEEGETKTEFIDYTLPDDLLWYDNETYDEFYLNYESQTCQVIKRCAYNADGTVRKLAEEVVTDYEYPTILLEDGDYQIKVLSYDTAYLSVRLMAQNMYTTQFATKAEMTSAIEQKADSIMLKVDEKVNEDEIIAQLNVAIQEGKGIVRLVGNQVIIDSDNFKLSSNGSMQANNGTFSGTITADSGKIGGFELTTQKFSSDFSGLYNYDEYDSREIIGILMGWLQETSILKNILDVNEDGTLSSADMVRIRKIIWGTQTNTKNVNGTFKIDSNDPKKCISVSKDGQVAVSIGVGGINANSIVTDNFVCGEATASGFRGTLINGENGKISCTSSGSYAETQIDYTGILTPVITQTSLATEKKNFEKFDNGLEIIKNTEIYQYNFKTEEDTDKKHIGFIIGDKYKYSEKITSKENNGVDIYSMMSVAYKAIQEQQQEIEQLKNEIKELKEMMRKGIQ